MRTAVGVLALVAGLLATSPAWAQQANGLSGAFQPRRIVNQPIDTTRAIAPPAFATQRPSFNLMRLFRPFAQPSFPPRHGVSPLPPPDSFPSTKYPNSFQPRKPIIPK